MTKTFNLSSGEVVRVTADQFIDRNIEVYVEGGTHLILSERDVANMMLSWRAAIDYLNKEDVCD